MDILESNAFKEIDLRYKSGNDVPINRTNVPKSEWDDVKKELSKHLVCINLREFPIEKLREGMRVISADRYATGIIVLVAYPGGPDYNGATDIVDVEWANGEATVDAHLSKETIWVIPDDTFTKNGVTILPQE